MAKNKLVKTTEAIERCGVSRVAFLKKAKKLGIEPAGKEGRGFLWTDSHVKQIAEAFA